LVIFTILSCGGGGGEGSSPAPPAPTRVTATAGYSKATIAWDNVAGATSYNIYFSTTSRFLKSTATKIAGVTSPNVVTPLDPGTQYYFVVTAVNDADESVQSSEVTVTPILAAPTVVRATAGDGEATIAWDNVSGATSYNLYYSSTAGVTKVTAMNYIAGVTSPRVVSPLTNGTTWYFVVTAVNANGESVESSQVSALPTAIPLVEYIAVGDSITEGYLDNIPGDGTGYEPILSNLITTRKGYPVTVVNKGAGGTTSADGALTISTTLSNYPTATYYLVQYGTNEAYILGGPPMPSGKGLSSGPGYDGSYKDNMQKIISAIINAGKIPRLAKVPSADNINYDDPSIRDYNIVVDELVALNGISVTPPDFYHLLVHPGNFSSDGFHPNGTGYQSMANLWFNALFP
jgi:lysophospholipase L1-like esterase